METNLSPDMKLLSCILLVIFTLGFLFEYYKMKVREIEELKLERSRSKALYELGAEARDSAIKYYALLEESQEKLAAAEQKIKEFELEILLFKEAKAEREEPNKNIMVSQFGDHDGAL